MTLESIQNPKVMEAATKQLQETGGGPLTSICTMQGFFPYKARIEGVLYCLIVSDRSV